MGSQLLRLALLLAVIQYAQVHAACADTRPLSKCPDNIPASIKGIVGCEGISISLMPGDSCERAGRKGTYLQRENVAGWEKIVYFTCLKGRWVAQDGYTNPKEIAITAKDNVVCAEHSPDLVPCKACRDITARYLCDDEAGCVKGGSIIHASYDAGCYARKCPAGELLLTDLPLSMKIESVKCKEGKWIADGQTDEHRVKEGICYKRFSCIKKTPLKSACHPLYDECAEITFKDDAKIECEAGKDMFYKSSSGDWTQIASFACTAHTGVWTTDPAVDLKSEDEVVCAKTKPIALCKTCNGPLEPFDCQAQAGCRKGSEKIDDSAACLEKTCSTGFFVDEDGSATQFSKLTCDVTGEWTGIVREKPTPSPNAICVEKFECQKFHPLNEKTEICAGIFEKEANCVPIPDFTVDAITCTGNGQQLFTKPKAGADWSLQGAVWCDLKKKKWMQGETDKSKWPLARPLVKGDAVICADRKPLTPENCKKPKSDCAEYYPCTEVTDLTAESLRCAEGQNLFVLAGNQWTEQGVVYCDYHVGKWKSGNSKESSQEMAPAVNVVCATSKPGPRVHCINDKFLEFNAQGCDKDNGAVFEAGCENVVAHKYTTEERHETLSCKSSNKKIFLKHSEWSYDLKENSFSCDFLKGWWKVQLLNGTEVTAQSGTTRNQFYCATSNPNPEPTTTTTTTTTAAPPNEKTTGKSGGEGGKEGGRGEGGSGGRGGQERNEVTSGPTSRSTDSPSILPILFFIASLFLLKP